MCLSKSELSWALSAPKVRPLLATGTVRTAKQSSGQLLKGEARLTFVDGSTAAIEFFLDHGKVADTTGETSPRISVIPGRISF